MKNATKQKKTRHALEYPHPNRKVEYEKRKLERKHEKDTQIPRNRETQTVNDRQRTTSKERLTENENR